MDLVQGEPLMKPPPTLPLPRTTYATASSSYTTTSTTRRRQRHRSDDPVDRDGRLAVVDRGGRQDERGLVKWFLNLKAL